MTYPNPTTLSPKKTKVLKLFHSKLLVVYIYIIYIPCGFLNIDTWKLFLWAPTPPTRGGPCWSFTHGSVTLTIEGSTSEGDILGSLGPLLLAGFFPSEVKRLEKSPTQHVTILMVTIAAIVYWYTCLRSQKYQGDQKKLTLVSTSMHFRDLKLRLLAGQLVGGQQSKSAHSLLPIHQSPDLPFGGFSFGPNI